MAWHWVVAILLVFPAAPGAHHSIAGVYDSSKPATVEAVVVEFQFINPHPFLIVETSDGQSGTPRQWRMEMDNRRELAGVGVTENTFRPGDRVVVRGSLARTEPRQLYIRRLDRPADGFWYEQVGSRPRIGSKS